MLNGVNPNNNQIGFGSNYKKTMETIAKLRESIDTVKKQGDGSGSKVVEHFKKTTGKDIGRADYRGVPIKTSKLSTIG